MTYKGKMQGKPPLVFRQLQPTRRQNINVLFLGGRMLRTLACLIGTIAIVALPGFSPLGDCAQDEPEYQHVWVHYDYMVFPEGWTSAAGTTYPNGLSMAPPPEAIDQVVEAFRAQGLTLHIDSIHNAIPGHQVVYPDFLPDWTNPSEACVGPDAVSFMGLKHQYFQPHDNHPWHYAIFGFNIGLPDTAPDGSLCPPDETGNPPIPGGFIDPTLDGLSELPGFNFVFGLGTFLDNTGLTPPLPVTHVGALFMHELGHNFGLEHGGVIPCVVNPFPYQCLAGLGLSSESRLKYKPNYMSVMGYAYLANGIYVAPQPGSAAFLQCSADPDCPGGSHCTNFLGLFGGVFRHVCYRLDYSREILPVLNEAALNEFAGVGGSPGDTDLVQYCSTTSCGLLGPSAGPIDWNGDGVIETSVAVDIDNDNGFARAPLHGFDDWTYVKQQLQVSPEVIDHLPKRAVQ